MAPANNLRKNRAALLSKMYLFICSKKISE
jgi:hypothetical protein